MFQHLLSACIGQPMTAVAVRKRMTSWSMMNI
jgi:hypothetical protein